LKFPNESWVFAEDDGPALTVVCALVVLADCGISPTGVPPQAVKRTAAQADTNRDAEPFSVIAFFKRIPSFHSGLHRPLDDDQAQSPLRLPQRKGSYGKHGFFLEVITTTVWFPLRTVE
jgi:hypothetical protein